MNFKLFFSETVQIINISALSFNIFITIKSFRLFLFVCLTDSYSLLSYLILFCLSLLLYTSRRVLRGSEYVGGQISPSPRSNGSFSRLIYLFIFLSI